DLRSALNFDECADHCLVADDATVEVDELGLGNAYSLAQPNVLANRHPRPYTDFPIERIASVRRRRVGLGTTKGAFRAATRRCASSGCPVMTNPSHQPVKPLIAAARRPKAGNVKLN